MESHLSTVFLNYIKGPAVQPPYLASAPSPVEPIAAKIFQELASPNQTISKAEGRKRWKESKWQWILKGCDEKLTCQTIVFRYFGNAIPFQEYLDSINDLLQKISSYKINKKKLYPRHFNLPTREFHRLIQHLEKRPPPETTLTVQQQHVLAYPLTSTTQKRSLKQAEASPFPKTAITEQLPLLSSSLTSKIQTVTSHLVTSGSLQNPKRRKAYPQSASSSKRQATLPPQQEVSLAEKEHSADPFPTDRLFSPLLPQQVLASEQPTVLSSSLTSKMQTVTSHLVTSGSLQPALSTALSSLPSTPGSSKKQAVSPKETLPFTTSPLPQGIHLPGRVISTPILSPSPVEQTATTTFPKLTLRRAYKSPHMWKWILKGYDEGLTDEQIVFRYFGNAIPLQKYLDHINTLCLKIPLHKTNKKKLYPCAYKLSTQEFNRLIQHLEKRPPQTTVTSHLVTSGSLQPTLERNVSVLSGSKETPPFTPTELTLLGRPASRQEGNERWTSHKKWKWIVEGWDKGLTDEQIIFYYFGNVISLNQFQPEVDRLVEKYTNKNINRYNVKISVLEYHHLLSHLEKRAQKTAITAEQLPVEVTWTPLPFSPLTPLGGEGPTDVPPGELFSPLPPLF